MNKNILETIIIIGIFWFPLQGFSQPRMSIHTNFENGNGRLVYRNIQVNSLAIRPELKNEDTIECWFNFYLTGHRIDTLLTLSIPFMNSHYAPDPLLVNMNGSWYRIPARNQGFYKQYIFTPLSDTLQIAAGIPYTYACLMKFLEEESLKPYVDISILTQSEKGRDVPLIRITDKTHNSKKGSLLLTGRQHAFEAPASYYMQGLLQFLTSDVPKAKLLRKHYEIYAVPMVDVDQVAEGGTGKDQRPRDFNRDWLENPHWLAVKAIQELANNLDAMQPLRFFLDIHSPFPISNMSSHFYVSYPQGSEKFLQLERFFQKYSEKEGFVLPMVRNYSVRDGQRTIRNYMDNPDWEKDGTPNYKNLLLATTYEQSWQTKPDGTIYTTEQIFESARNMGFNIYEFLKEMDF